MSTPASLNDLMYAFFGGTPSLSDAMRDFYLAAYNAGLTASAIIAGAIGGDFFGNYSGTGSPEGSVTAPVGAVYLDTNGPFLYGKTSGSGNTGWELITTGSSGLVNVASFDFAYNTPNIRTGIDTGITIPEGAFIPNGGAAIIVTTPFNGTDPAIIAASLRASSIDWVSSAGNIVFESSGLVTPDTNGNLAIPSDGYATFNYVYAYGGDVTVWLGLTKSGVLGPANPGSTAGAGTLLVTYVTP